MRADTFAPGGNQAPSSVSDSSNDSTQHFASVSNRPGRVTFEPRTAEAEAQDRAALILRRLRAAGIFDALNRRRKSKVAAIALLYSMCFDHGRVEPLNDGLVVRIDIKELATWLGFSPRSAYRPMRLLEEVGAVNRISGCGNVAHDYAIPMPVRRPGELSDEEQEVARANGDAAQVPSLNRCSAAQGARANGDASLLSDAENERNSRTEYEIARASSDASLNSDAPESANAGFSTRNARASLLARAGFPPTAAITASAAAAEGEGAEGKPQKPQIDDLSKIAAELEKVGLSGEQAIEYAGRAGMTLRTAIALRMEMMQNRKWPWIIPIALGILNGTSKRGLSNTSLREADRELGVAGGGSAPASASTKPAWMTDFAWKRWGSWSAAERESRLYAVASKYSGNSTVMSVIQAAIAGKSLPPSWLIDDAARVPATPASAPSGFSSV